MALYIVLFLHQTATSRIKHLSRTQLYIVLFLHQTATQNWKFGIFFSCISFYSYIKPQRQTLNPFSNCVVYRSIPTSNRNDSWSLRVRLKVVYRSIPTSNRNRKGASTARAAVVYRSIPTSNRNFKRLVVVRQPLYIVLFLHQTATLYGCYFSDWRLYIVLFLHQTATDSRWQFAGELLYIVLFLHQTATTHLLLIVMSSCISFYSYIKPQLDSRLQKRRDVVYRSIPTSNRN